MGILDQIVESKRRELLELGASEEPETPFRAAEDVWRALRRSTGHRDTLQLIAEIKRRSPSAGRLSCVLSVEERALAYARAGASMISVLCDKPFFDGGFDALARARRALDDVGVALPLLAKEFVIDRRQVRLAREAGADAVLIIARIAPGGILADLVRASFELGIEPFVEVTTMAELDATISAGARVIGVNARDLDTLVIDKANAARVLAEIPEAAIRVHLSGLGTPADVALVKASGASAALIGEALMREDDPEPLLAAMVSAARS